MQENANGDSLLDIAGMTCDFQIGDLDVVKYDMIIMSQSCNLEFSKIDLVLICPGCSLG